MILDFEPGEAAQVDFGKGPDVADPRTGELTGTWVFVMTLTWSRHQYAELVSHQNVETWLGCHRRAYAGCAEPCGWNNRRICGGLVTINQARPGPSSRSRLPDVQPHP